MITIGLSPNTQNDDVLIALKTFLTPWGWKKGRSITKIEKWFQDRFNTPIAHSFNSGRSAFLALLQSYDIGVGDEVIVQSFTCLAVPEVVKWLGAKPVFTDVDDTLNIDHTSLEKSITYKTKAIIVQHTFGIPAKMELITKITQKHGLILIEDCAHALGASYNERKVGTFGDASFFSFGRDKVVSSVFGGLALINNHSIKFYRASKKLDQITKKLNYPSFFWIFQQLIHPLAFFFILPMYNLVIGKIFLVFLQKIRLLSFPIYIEEKEGKKPSIFPMRYPNGLASLLINQLNKLEKLNNYRNLLAEKYFEELKSSKNIFLPPKIPGSIFLRFNVLTKNSSAIHQKAKESGILLGNWYHDVIDPQGSKEIADYKNGSCPNAEQIAVQSLNLPTNIKTNISDVFKIIKLIKNYGSGN